MSFRDYIARSVVTRTPEGDFVSDAKTDKNLPDAQTWDELKCYLQSVSPAGAVIEAAREVWRSYKATQGHPDKANA